LQKARDPVLNQLYKKTIEPYKDSTPVSSLEGLSHACNDSHFAFIYSVDSFGKHASDVACQLTHVPHAKIETLKGMATVKGSPYLGLFRHM
jgi:hypothetical protein